MRLLTPRFGYAAAAISLVTGVGVAAAPAPVQAAPAQLAPAQAAPAQAPAASGSIKDCALSSLPAQASDTTKLIKKGGPFPYPKNDGVVFTNREGVLPAESTSYYHEYTVPTPGASNRGTRRIVTGGTPLTAPPVWYYTGDHYDSFCKITGIN